MSHLINVQYVVPKKTMPLIRTLKQWATASLTFLKVNAELNIRIVGIEEMTNLNTQYRHKNKPTNVLSFPFDMPEGIEEELLFLGDIVICADVVNQEALDQMKPRESHWAHMVVHGTLHLMGYDHETDAQAAEMEPKEIEILQSLGFPNPYQTEVKGDCDGRG